MTKKNTPTTPNGIEKILALLNKNKDDIGSIVVAICPKPGSQLTAEDGDKCDGLYYSADIVLATTDEERQAVGIKSLITTGLATDLAQRFVFGKSRGLFG